MPAQTSESGARPPARREATLRPVTVLFCDIKDSTEMISRLNSEAALKILSMATEAMAAAVHAAGGTVLKLLGDGVMAVFGVPVAQPDHALRACRAGLDIIGRVTAAFDGDPAIERHRPQVRVGLNSGEVAFSMAHLAAGQTELDVIGDQVSLAARVESAAEPGAVYMTESTHRRVHGAVKADFAGSRMLHGFATPVALYRLWAVTEPTRPLVDEALHFVGRSRELEELRQFLSKLREGRGGAFLIFGEPGIGKTRLLEEVRRDAVSAGLSWLRAGSPPLSENVPYWAFSELLRALLGVHQGRLPDWETHLSAVHRILGADNTELDPAEAGAFLARILRIEVPEPWNGRLAALDADATYRQSLRVWWRFFDALAAQGPMVLEFDDLQWVDPASAGVISHILPLVRERSIAIIGCGRSDDEGPTGRLVTAAREALGAQFTELRLHPLSPSETKDLLAEALGANPELVAVRRLVLDRSEGNPFFIEEIIRALKQMQLLVQGPERQWTLACPLEQVQLPESLQELILARVDRLDEGMREVVRDAAVIGRQFLYRVLAAVSERSLDLDEKVKVLQRKELIDCMHQFPELEYIFKHAVVQETIYASLFEERRRKIHRSVAECLESLFAGKLEQFCAVLAYHYFRAEDWTSAQRYLFLAADQAHRLAADDDALHSFEQALSLLDKVPERKVSSLEVAMIERKLGDVHYRRGDIDTAQGHYRRALALFGRSDPKTRVGVRIRIALELVRHALFRLRHGRKLPAARVIPEGRRELFKLLEGIAWSHFHQDPERLLLGLLRGLSVAEPQGFHEGMAKGYAALSYVLNILGWFGLASWYQSRALACAAGKPDCIGLIESIIGFHHTHRGCFDEALRHLELSRQSSRQGMDWNAWASATVQSANVLSLRGEIGASFSKAQQLTTIGREVSLNVAICWGQMLQGRALYQVGHRDEGLRVLREAIVRASLTPDYQCVIHGQGTLALFLFSEGAIDQAEEAVVEAIGTIDRQRLRGDWTMDARVASVQLAARRLADADAIHRGPLLREARRCVGRALRQARVFAPGMPAALRMQAIVEAAAGHADEAAHYFNESARIAEGLGMRLELALTLRERGRLLCEPESTERGERLLGELLHAAGGVAP